MKLIPSVKDNLASLPTIKSAADKVEILHTARDFRQCLLSLIESARKRIYLTALYLQDDKAGREILTALYEAKNKNPNLEVKVFVDYSRAQRGLIGQPESIGNVRLYRELDQAFEHPIEIIGVPVKTKEFLGVLHLKGFVIDDTVLYSGASLNDIYLQQTERYRCDRYQKIESTALADSFVQYLRVYLLSSPAARSLLDDGLSKAKQLKPAINKQKKNLRRSSYQFSDSEKKSKNTDTVSGDIEITPLIGFGGRKNLLNKTILQVIRQTQHHLVLYTPYFNLPRNVAKAVKKLLKKGISVDILVGDKTANDFYIPPTETFTKIGIVPYVYEYNLKRFATQNQAYIDKGLLNILIWKDGDNSYHLKGISSDSKRYLLTGHNLNPRACKLDLENGILIQDPEQLLKPRFDEEREYIQKNTQRLESASEIQGIKDYPAEVAKLMRSVKRAKLDAILNRLL